jgi:hypothetical protein
LIFSFAQNQILIGGASIANFFQMVRKRNPQRDKPLIDYSLAMILQPLSLGGTVIGVLLNTMFPNWLLLLLLILVLAITLERTIMKGIRMWKDEKRPRFLEIEENFGREEMESLNSGSPELNSILQSERKIPLAPFFCMAFILTIAIVLAILKGSSKFQVIRVPSCSAIYWVLSLGSLPIVSLVAFFVAIFLIHQHKKKEKCDYPFRVSIYLF